MFSRQQQTEAGTRKITVQVKHAADAVSKKNNGVWNFNRQNWSKSRVD